MQHLVFYISLMLVFRKRDFIWNVFWNTENMNHQCTVDILQYFSITFSKQFSSMSYLNELRHAIVQESVFPVENVISQLLVLFNS